MYFRIVIVTLLLFISAPLLSNDMYSGYIEPWFLKSKINKKHSNKRGQRVFHCPKTEKQRAGLTDVGTSSRTVTISLWDHGAEDGDRVMIFFNKEIIAKNFLLTHTKKSFELKITQTKNTLAIIALNEGSASPNTASISMTNLTHGSSQQRWNLSTSERASLDIILKSKYE